MKVPSASTKRSHVTFEGGTLHVDPNKNGGRPNGGTTCYYPDDDSVYFDCEETTEEKLRVCYCGE